MPLSLSQKEQYTNHRDLVRVVRTESLLQCVSLIGKGTMLRSPFLALFSFLDSSVATNYACARLKNLPLFNARGKHLKTPTESPVHEQGPQEKVYQGRASHFTCLSSTSTIRILCSKVNNLCSASCPHFSFLVRVKFKRQRLITVHTIWHIYIYISVKLR